MITDSVLYRVFNIKNKLGLGSCFVADFETKQYIITAKHVIKDFKTGDEIELFVNRNWKKYQLNLIGHSTNEADISVFSINEILVKPINVLELSSNKISIGQDVYFLGFPYGIKSDVKVINNDITLPLVKKAIMSAIIPSSTGVYMFLDGHNNPGFSGGPVVFKERDGDGRFKIASVISGYRFNLEPTYENGKPTNIIVQQNTGIIIAYNIEEAINIIKTNPNGLETK